MDMSNIIVIASGVIGAIGLWVGNHISNKPKRMDANQNRIEFIVENTIRMYEECEKRHKRLVESNRTLREQNRKLKQELKDKNKRR